MIFYFTGTGNSLYAAQKLADEGEKIENDNLVISKRPLRCRSSRGYQT